jgi:hypothetical protein
VRTGSFLWFADLKLPKVRKTYIFSLQIYYISTVPYPLHVFLCLFLVLSLFSRFSPEVGKMKIVNLLPLSLSSTRHVFFIESEKFYPLKSGSSTIDKDRCRGQDLCLRFFEKVRSVTPFDRMSGIRSVSCIRPTCQCRCPPLVLPTNSAIQKDWKA